MIYRLESVNRSTDALAKNRRLISFSILFHEDIQFTTSSRRLDGGAYCGAPVGGKFLLLTTFI